MPAAIDLNPIFAEGFRRQGENTRKSRENSRRCRVYFTDWRPVTRLLLSLNMANVRRVSKTGNKNVEGLHLLRFAVDLHLRQHLINGGAADPEDLGGPRFMPANCL
jgi:hypothetical protein